METVVQRNLPMILMRIIMGLMFVFEGALKFIRPEQLGVGHFAAIGLPDPQLLAPLVGGIEIGGGAAILLNLYAGDAALAMLAIILTAFVSTKVPILLGKSLGPFVLAPLNEYGWVSFFHESRTDLLTAFVLLAIILHSGIRVGRKRRWYQEGS
jgi:putative oxidoreductase